ncbi:MAG: hypothetical protein R3C30_14940 [Hyphomonadaceae bacterium]
MRVVLFAAALVLTGFAVASNAKAQSLQCRQQLTQEQRELCAETEIDDLDDQVKYWREAARQSRADYDYFANRRARCDDQFACIARELQTEISELQVRLEPAALARVRSAYTGPIVYRAVTTMTELDAVMDRIVTRDSWGWMFNRYDRGSVRNTRVEHRSGRDRIVYSDYTYNGGTPGWVRLYIVDGRLGCVEYHDFSGTCRPIGARSYAYGITSRLLAAAAGY